VWKNTKKVAAKLVETRSVVEKRKAEILLLKQLEDHLNKAVLLCKCLEKYYQYTKRYKMMDIEKILGVAVLLGIS